MKLTDTRTLPEKDAKLINAVASQADQHGLLPYLTINHYSATSIQLELRDRNGQLVYRAYTFERNFIAGFLPYLKPNYCGF